MTTTNHSLQFWENENLSTLKEKLCVPMLENNISRCFIDEETGSVSPSDLPDVMQAVNNKALVGI